MRCFTPSKFRSAAAALGVTALVLSGCSGSDDSKTPDTPTAATAESGTPKSSDEATDEAAGSDADATESSDDAKDAEVSGEETADGKETSNALPTKIVDAGTVKPGTTRTASDKKEALVTFKQSDAFAVVAEFDCKECKGDIELQQLGSQSPLDTGNKSLAGSYLLDLIGSAEEEQTLIVRADGEWNIKLRSWNDLPISSGTQEGKGSKVLYIGDSASAVEVEYKPPKGGGKLSVTVTSAVEKDGDTPEVAAISGGKKFTKKKEIKLPGVITVSGKGSWKIKLIS